MDGELAEDGTNDVGIEDIVLGALLRKRLDSLEGRCQQTILI